MFLESKSSVKNVEFKIADSIWRPAERETILSLSFPNSGITNEEMARVYSYFVFFLLLFLFFLFFCLYILYIFIIFVFEIL